MTFGTLGVSQPWYFPMLLANEYITLHFVKNIHSSMCKEMGLGLGQGQWCAKDPMLVMWWRRLRGNRLPLLFLLSCLRHWHRIRENPLGPFFTVISTVSVFFDPNLIRWPVNISSYIQCHTEVLLQRVWLHRKNFSLSWPERRWWQKMSHPIINMSEAAFRLVTVFIFQHIEHRDAEAPSKNAWGCEVVHLHTRGR